MLTPHHRALVAFITLFSTGITNSIAHDYNGAKIMSPKQQLGLLFHINLNVKDDIINGCWSSPGKVKSRARLLFEQNGVGVVEGDQADDSFRRPTVKLSAVGYRTGGICTAFASLTVNQPTLHIYGGAGQQIYAMPKYSELWSASILMSNGSILNNQMEDFAEEKFSELIADILSARREKLPQEIVESYPWLSESPEK